MTNLDLDRVAVVLIAVAAILANVGLILHTWLMH